MKIMCTDDSEAVRRAAERLEDEGHEVLRHCTPGHHPGVCTGLHAGTCALDERPDVAIAGPTPRGGAASAGQVCAQRAAVRVVAVGIHDAEHPEFPGQLARAARHGDAHVEDLVDLAVARACERLGIDGAVVEVRRDPDRETIVVTVPSGVDEQTRARLAVIALDAATASRHSPPVRDVAVEAATGD